MLHECTSRPDHQSSMAFGVSRAQFGVTEVQGSLKRSDIKRKYEEIYALAIFRRHLTLP